MKYVLLCFYLKLNPLPMKIKYQNSQNKKLSMLYSLFLGRTYIYEESSAYIQHKLL